MNINQAKEIKNLALNAIESLTRILTIANNDEQYQDIKKGVGLSIGSVQIEILEIINDQYPELDDLS